MTHRVIPDEVVIKLHLGLSLAAELPDQEEMRFFVMIIPQTPSRHEHPEFWTDGPVGSRMLRDPSFISGYEIRYVSHHKKYTESKWGFDYDYVLYDETTRIKRLFVQNQEDIAVVLATEITDFSMLHEVGDFDSSLLNSPLDSYLNSPDELPHL